MGYAMAFVEIYGYIIKEKNTTNSVIQGVAKSLITFYATPVEQSRQAELEAKLFRSPCRCVSIFPQLHLLHGYPNPSIQFHAGACKITNLDTFVVLLSTLTGCLISGTQVYDNGDVRAWRRRMAQLVEKQASGVAQAFTNWFEQAIGARETVRVVWHAARAMPQLNEGVRGFRWPTLSMGIERQHKLVAIEYLAKTQARSPRIDLIFHGAGCMAEVALLRFNCRTIFP